MSSGHPAPEARSRNWGGRRPGAGAPRGNRNAARPNPPPTVRETAAGLLGGAPVRDFLRSLPPAMRELVIISLAIATDRAITEAERQTAPLPEEDSDRAQLRAAALASQLLLTSFVDAWRIDRRSRDQRESAAVRVLRPWLRAALEEIGAKRNVTPRDSSQSRSESAPVPTINLNQERAC